MPCGIRDGSGTPGRTRERGRAAGRVALRRMSFFGLRAMMP